LGLVIVLPIFERADAGRYYNSAAVIDADGRLLGTYRKMHVPLLPLWQEKYYFAPGDAGWPVFDTAAGRIGVQICWDNFFPEGSRILALKGAGLIISPTAAAFASKERWKTALAANAVTNGLFLFRVNRIGDEESHSFYGQSFCVNPEGEMAGSPGGDKEGLFEAKIDLSDVGKTQNLYPYLKLRRPETYGDITRPKSEYSDKIRT